MRLSDRLFTFLLKYFIKFAGIFIYIRAPKMGSIDMKKSDILKEDMRIK